MFSPDGDGVDDELEVTITVTHDFDIAGWRIEILEPYPPYLTFAEWSDEGTPPETIIWDGYSESGELVQSASDYRYKLTVSDIYGNISTNEGYIWVDVLVLRDGDILRVIVPSIMFPPNLSSFDSLDPDTIVNNIWVLQRIAQVLNKAEFSTYRVKVEGHANPTTPPNTRARDIEETGTPRELGLLPLSEARARTVVDYLIVLGVDQGRLSYIGVGSARIIVEFEDRDNWWKNRRVEFILEKPSTPAVEESFIEEPLVEEPLIEEPLIEEPSAEEPAVEEEAEEE